MSKDQHRENRHKRDERMKEARRKIEEQPQEWTVEESGKTEVGEQFYSLMEGTRVIMCGLSDVTPISDAHNAAIAAAYEKGYEEAKETWKHR